MLPEPGELEEMLELETLVRAKIRAAGVYGMEVEVIEGIESELRAVRRAARRRRRRAARRRGRRGCRARSSASCCARSCSAPSSRASSQRIERLPWGIGAAFRQTAPEPIARAPRRVLRDPDTADGGRRDGYRYWRYVETTRRGARLRPRDAAPDRPGAAGEPADVEGVDLEARMGGGCGIDRRGAQPARRPARRAGRDRPGAALRARASARPDRDPARRAERAAEALAVERSTAVRRELNGIAAEAREETDLAQRSGPARRRAGRAPRAPARARRRRPRARSPRTTSALSAGWPCWMPTKPAFSRPRKP